LITIRILDLFNCCNTAFKRDYRLTCLTSSTQLHCRPWLRQWMDRVPDAAWAICCSRDRPTPGCFRSWKF